MNNRDQAETNTNGVTPAKSIDHPNAIIKTI